MYVQEDKINRAGINADEGIKRIFECFYKAVEKAQNLRNPAQKVERMPETFPATGGYIFIKVETKMVRVELDDILFIEKEENYLAFQTNDKRILVRANMTSVFDFVPESKFCRVHKSFVVGVKHIHTVEIHQVTINKYKIPVGGSYRENLINRIN